MAGERVLCLSIKQPWAETLVRGQKQIETRTWRPNAELVLPRLVAIHASKRPDDDAPMRVWLLNGKVFDRDAWRLRLGCIIGAALLVEIVDYRDPEAGRNRWFDDWAAHLCPLTWWTGEQYGFRFEYPVAFEQVLGLKGSLGLFPLDEETGAEVRRLWEEAL